MRYLAPILALTIVTVAGATPPDLFRVPPPPPPNAIDLQSVHIDARAPKKSPSYFDEHQDRVMRDFWYFEHGFTLDDVRERDRLQLYGPAPGGFTASTEGVSLLAGAILGAAHAPGPLRALFDRNLHLGPAILVNGGMGAGVGLRF